MLQIGTFHTPGHYDRTEHSRAEHITKKNTNFMSHHKPSSTPFINAKKNWYSFKKYRMRTVNGQYLVHSNADSLLKYTYRIIKSILDFFFYYKYYYSHIFVSSLCLSLMSFHDRVAFVIIIIIDSIELSSLEVKSIIEYIIQLVSLEYFIYNHTYIIPLFYT